MHPDWARSLRDQCQAAGVPFFFKQWGEWAPAAGAVLESTTPVAWPDGKVCGGRAKDHGGAGINLRPAGKKAAGRRLDGREWSEFPA
jgi:protein gp37